MTMSITTVPLKRSRDQEGDTQVENLARANCMMLLSRFSEDARAFECKTCNRKFSSFQALGGHRANHKRPKLASDAEILAADVIQVKSKTHKCSICGMEFPIGQALGGHMRRHRKEGSQEKGTTTTVAPPPLAINKSKSSMSRLSCLDLNLIPFENEVSFGNKFTTPVLIQFF